MRIIFYPTLIVGILLSLNILFFDSWIVYVLCILFGVIVYPVQANLMFHVVENPEEFDYPNRMPRLRELTPYWWHYYLPFLKIFVVGILLYFVLFLTMFGPIVVGLVLPLAIVIAQREEDAGLNAFITAAKYIFQSFWNYCMCYLGNTIIMYSLAFSPYIVWVGIASFIRLFISKSVYMQMNHIFGDDSFFVIATGFAIFGGVIGTQINTIVYHFFYGHAKEKQEHPALIDEIERFEEK